MIERFPVSPETSAMAARVIWFETPETALADAARLTAYAITFGTEDDIAILRKHMTDADLREALKRAPPGIIDARSWNFWHLKLGVEPVPPLPERRIP